MKFLKLFSIIALSAVTMNMFAAIDAQVNIAVEADNSEFGDQIDLYQDNASTYYADDIAASGDYAVNMYAVVNQANYSSVKQASLNNLKVVFKANKKETAYTMTFSDVLGSITLQNADTSFVIDATKPYAFTCEKEATIEFTVNPVVPGYERKNLTISNWGTLCLPYASSKVEGANIFTVAGKDKATDPTGVYLLPYTSNLVAGTPYVFQATATELKVTYTGDSVVAGNANGLIGSYTEENIAAGMYIIVDNQLKQTADATCSVRANGAYFDFSQMSVYTPTPSSPARFMSIRGAATGLEAAEAPAMMEGKMIINGKLVIIRDGKMFNAQGAQL